MAETITLDAASTEAEQTRELAEQCLTAIRESNERARQTQSETTEFQAETRVLLQQLRMTLHVETNR
ncbi:MAG: hypothetical protein ACKV2V_03615 [Blastocatellia bacterium]